LIVVLKHRNEFVVDCFISGTFDLIISDSASF